MSDSRKISNIIIIIALALFLCSLMFDAYCTSDCGSALLTLLLGWMGLFMEIGGIASWVIDLFHGKAGEFNQEIGATFSWLANPIFVLALFLIRRSPRYSLFYANMALLFMISFALFDQVISTEAGHYNRIRELGTGYWLWLFSAVILVIGSFVRVRVEGSLAASVIPNRKVGNLFE